MCCISALLIIRVRLLGAKKSIRLGGLFFSFFFFLPSWNTVFGRCYWLFLCVLVKGLWWTLVRVSVVYSGWPDRFEYVYRKRKWKYKCSADKILKRSVMKGNFQNEFQYWYTRPITAKVSREYGGGENIFHDGIEIPQTTAVAWKYWAHRWLVLSWLLLFLLFVKTSQARLWSSNESGSMPLLVLHTIQSENIIQGSYRRYSVHKLCDDAFNG